jgi:hypothetical protein
MNLDDRRPPGEENPRISIEPHDFPHESKSDYFGVSDSSARKGSSTRQTETRKLLLYILEQLKLRPLPPSVFSVQTPVVKGPSSTEDDDSDDGEHTFSTDGVYDLMSQLRDVLFISVIQGWQIFDSRYANLLLSSSLVLTSVC